MTGFIKRLSMKQKYILVMVISLIFAFAEPERYDPVIWFFVSFIVILYLSDVPLYLKQKDKHNA